MIYDFLRVLLRSVTEMLTFPFMPINPFTIGSMLDLHVITLVSSCLGKLKIARNCTFN